MYIKSKQTEKNPQRTKTAALVLCVAVSIGLTCALAMTQKSTETSTSNGLNKDKSAQVATNDMPKSYIISSPELAMLRQDLAQMGVTPTHELGIINAVAADLSHEQIAQLQQNLTVKITPNYTVESAGVAWGIRRYNPEAVIPDLVEARQAHSAGNYGAGVTIGFLDTGLDNLTGLQNNLYGNDKYWGTYDAINNVAYNTDNEANGHGTHVGSVAGNSDYDGSGKIYGVAPNALLVGIKAFDSQGKASYADVIRGVDWAVTKKDDINLRVLNMSFSGQVHTYYWEDPLNIAIMKAWQAGIVVVASAGNLGPNPMTIGVPGNNPYIITVGAMTDNYTPTDTSDDKLASFSSAGPTVEGHIKPELIAPGGHISGLMDTDTTIVTEHPDFHDGGRYYQMSGTSQAAGVVSGVAALMLTADPTLSPDDVKCRLIASAKAARNADGSLAYSVFQQGAGMVNAKNALASSASNCANNGLDIGLDIAGQQHYYGPAAIDSNGDIYLQGHSSDYAWDIPTDLNSTEGDTWRTAIKSSGGYSWNLATDGGSIWIGSFLQSNNYSWRDNYESEATRITNETLKVDGGSIWIGSISDINTQSINVNNWVDQE